jgi:hypothetical protein
VKRISSAETILFVPLLSAKMGDDNANNNRDDVIESNIDISDEGENSEGGNYLGDNQESWDGEWRDLFVQICLRLSRNDTTLVDLDDWRKEGINSRRWIWMDSDLVLLGRSLQGNTHLRSLSIQPNLCPCCETGSWNSACDIQRGIRDSRLETIELRKDMCIDLQEAIYIGVSMSSTLRSVKVASIRDLDVSCMVRQLLTDQGGLYQPCRLTRFSLCHVQVSPPNLQALSICLGQNTSLVSLHLQDNGITDEGVINLCQFWTDDSPLQELNLRNNLIGASGVQTLMNTVAGHGAMQTLVLSKNCQSGYQILKAIGEALPLCHLQHLEIDACVRNSNFVDTPKVARDEACQVLAQGLRGNSSLKSFRVGNNHLGDTGAEMLTQAFAVHPTLQKLVMDAGRLIEPWT